MLSQKSQQKLRGVLFRHLDGIVTAPAAFALYEKGVLEYLLDKKKVDLREVTADFNANEGYLNVALRTLCSQGWLVQHINNELEVVEYGLSDLSEIAFSHVHLYADAVRLLKFSERFSSKRFEKELFDVLEKIFEKYRNNHGVKFSKDEKRGGVQRQILKHIEGVIVGPIVVYLGMSGMFHKYFMEALFRPEEFHNDPENFGKLLKFFVHLGWFNENNDTYQFSDAGLFFAKRARSYGVTVSYIPTLRNLDELIFGNPNILRNTDKDVPEKHVDREMNVWGSGASHSPHFQTVDEIIIDIFNRPIDEQPKGVVDVGCGNGAFLKHLFEVIEHRTERGKILEEHPLFLVGVDYNEAALKAARTTLIKADIWSKVIWGDIGRPDLLAESLANDYDINLNDLLNVRRFLDHNIIWKEPKVKNKSRKSESTGAFAHKGSRISANLVEDALLEHFNKWKPFVTKFGLLVIELHTTPPALTAGNLGETAATAHDAVHGYSDQYMVEVEVFSKIAAEANLYSEQSLFRKFPDSDLATITVNLFFPKPDDFSDYDWRAYCVNSDY